MIALLAVFVIGFVAFGGLVAIANLLTRIVRFVLSLGCAWFVGCILACIVIAAGYAFGAIPTLAAILIGAFLIHTRFSK